MKKINLFIVLFALSFSIFVKAESDSGPSEDKAISSHERRTDKTFFFGAQAAGYGPGVGFGTGGYAGLFLTPDDLLFIEIDRTDASPILDLDEKKVTQHSYGIHYKKFTENSFYYRLGLDQIRTSYSGTDFYNNFSSYFRGESTVLSFSIGNQWQWKNFTLGADWVGYALPLAYKVSDDFISSGATSYDQTRFNDDQERLTKKGHILLVRFYLGFSF